MLSRARAAEARQLVAQLEAQAPGLVGQLLAVIDRNTAAERGWSFVMLSPSQNRAVVRWLMANSRRESVALALWAEFFCHLRTDTGEIVMSRAEMMAASGGTSPHVSVVLSELLSIGAVIRRQEGREVRWFMNPNVATHLTGIAREKAQCTAPKLEFPTECKRAGRKADPTSQLKLVKEGAE
jgi:DNA-binding transcriptional ArsR family regulator